MHYPIQDSQYQFDPHGDIEDNIGDNKEHDDDKETIEMKEDREALTTEH